MQTTLAPAFQNTPHGQEAEAILRKCVHCGFCTATCPTYQLLGDELDGPRGRIDLIKQVLEGVPPTRETQRHLDRCLTCRNCETTCPSGVAYGQLLEIGRRLVDERVARPPAERRLRAALRNGLASPLVGPAVRVGQAVRSLLPERLQARVPPRRDPGAWPRRTHARKLLLLQGCVQPALNPNIDHATARVLDAAGIQLVRVRRQGCCGAVRLHTGDEAGALQQARTNIDAWWPHLDAGAAEGIVVNASGCAVTVKDYGHLLRHDPAYADKAARVAAQARDLSEWLPELVPLLRGKVRAPGGVLAFQAPCSLQHGQQVRGVVEAALVALGFSVRLPAEAHLCCGSAGTYSVLQPELAQQLRQRKLDQLLGDSAADHPAAVVSANIGCITHLQSGTEVPVRHWVELLDECLLPATPEGASR